MEQNRGLLRLFVNQSGSSASEFWPPRERRFWKFIFFRLLMFIYRL